MSAATETNTSATAANGAPLPPLPADHLSHPEKWTTGAEPATEKQKAFVAILEDENPSLVPEGGLDKEDLTKSEACEVIDELKKGEKVEQHGASTSSSDGEGKKDTLNDDAEGKKESSAPSKRKSLDCAESSPANPASVDETPNSTSDDNTEADLKAEATSSDEHRPIKKPKTKQEHPTSSPPADDIVTPAEGKEAAPLPDEIKVANEAANGEGAGEGETIPGDGEHLAHPENWATGDEPATDKQKGFIKVLEKQKGAAGSAGNVENLGKSEASEKIEELKAM